MSKKNKPPRIISKGSIVTYNGNYGVVIGDHLSPGGMQGTFLVLLCFPGKTKDARSNTWIPSVALLPVYIEQEQLAVISEHFVEMLLPDDIERRFTEIGFMHHENFVTVY